MGVSLAGGSCCVFEGNLWDGCVLEMGVSLAGDDCCAFEKNMWARLSVFMMYI